MFGQILRYKLFCHFFIYTDFFIFKSLLILHCMFRFLSKIIFKVIFDIFLVT
jgi:hypothetical protein